MCLILYTRRITMGLVLVLIILLISITCMALIGIVIASLGMGGIAPWGQVISNVCAVNAKGLLYVKKNICGCCPPRGDTRSSC